MNAFVELTENLSKKLLKLPKRYKYKYIQIQYIIDRYKEELPQVQGNLLFYTLNEALRKMVMLPNLFSSK